MINSATTISADIFGTPAGSADEARLIRRQRAVGHFYLGVVRICDSAIAIRRSLRREEDTAEPPNRGLTLLELLVVLVLLGLAISLAAPSFLAPGGPPDDDVQRVIDVARRTAVRRAQAVTLAIESDGRWVIEGSSGLDSGRLLTGTVTWTQQSPVRLDISPLGACLLYARTSSLTIDPVRCRLRGRSG
ncbi:MAG: prepilin-type N-terminal cleavage/methylation domain-containing protein [Gemmatimonadetes bacterium]|nr:prepilin-type N-terminal cleavage/methylation domain-containing protein [Gemmatimonadota bacterium]